MNIWQSLLPATSKRKRKPESAQIPQPATLSKMEKVRQARSDNPAATTKELAAATVLRLGELRRAVNLYVAEIKATVFECVACDRPYSGRPKARKYADHCSECAKKQAMVDFRRREQAARAKRLAG